MADITAALIKRVRELTGAGMTDVKRALVDADGDESKAIEALRIKGAKDIGKREGRAASNGLVAASLDGATKVLLELNCETDFVAKNETFQALATDLAAHVATTGTGDLDALLAEPFGGGTVREALDNANAALGEKIELRRVVSFDGAHVASYLHRTAKDLPPTIGVLVEMDRDVAELGKDLAQHISFSAPRYLSRDEVPAEVVESERRLAEQIAREEGKPEAALAKIVEGRLNGFYRDICLLEQGWVREPKKTIRALVEDAGATVVRFARFKVGQA